MRSKVGLLHLLAEVRHFAHGGIQAIHPGGQLARQSLSLLGAHGVQGRDQLIQASRDLLLDGFHLLLGRAPFASQYTGKTEKRIEIGLVSATHSPSPRHERLPDRP